MPAATLEPIKGLVDVGGLDSPMGSTPALTPWSFLTAPPCSRNVDRPELCQVSLYDFQKFLLHDQKVGALRDPRGITLSPNPWDTLAQFPP